MKMATTPMIVSPLSSSSSSSCNVASCTARSKISGRSAMLAMFLLFLAQSTEGFNPCVVSSSFWSKLHVPAMTPRIVYRPTTSGTTTTQESSPWGTRRLAPPSLHRGGGGGGEVDDRLGLSMSTVAISADAGTESQTRLQQLEKKFPLLANFAKDSVYGLGTRTHLINGLTSLVILCAFALIKGRRTCSALSSFALFFGFTGLFLDNMINASGKFVGPGRKLQRLNKLRLILHGGGVPLLLVPIVEAAFFQGLLKAQVASRILVGCTGFALYELFHWLAYDSNKFQVVDNRDSPEHSVRYLAGTLTYTSGKVLQCVLPAAFLSLFEVTIGAFLFKKSLAGAFLLAAGLVSLGSCSVPKRPDIQLYGETVGVGLLWAAAACVC